MFSETLHKAVTTLQEGKIILYPTDTVWGIGCDATNQDAVKQVFAIKKRHEIKSLIILVSDFAMLQEYVSVSNSIIHFLATTNRPTSIVYEQVKGLADGVIAQDGSVAIRIAQDDFCPALIGKLGKPIVSTSANISGQATAKTFADIDDYIKNAVDYIVDYKQDSNYVGNSSRLVRFRDDKPLILRE